VVHRFCETFLQGDDPLACLRHSFADVMRMRQSQFADRLIDIDAEKALAELLPLAENYLSSAVFQRVMTARALAGLESNGWPSTQAGLWSELSFRLRRKKGILTGAVDKLIILPVSEGGFAIEIVDFKTNRVSRSGSQAANASQADMRSLALESVTRGRKGRPRPENQIAFDFAAPELARRSATGVNDPSSVADEVARIAGDYQLQMQAYALAVRELLPATIIEVARIKVTLHFLDPNVEYCLPESLLSMTNCAQAIDEAMTEIISARAPENFPARAAGHCRMCNFLELCAPGRAWLSEN
jgi:ATP-dependent exoDNAse (exonuclease V) beta subunit